MSLEETPYWKDFEGFIRSTCELARYGNMPESVRSGLSGESMLLPVGPWPMRALERSGVALKRRGAKRRGLPGTVGRCDDHM